MSAAGAKAAELCVLLVNDIYGEVSSKVFKTLLQHGRLVLPKICQYTDLPQTTVKQTLVVLIQQHLVIHFSHFDTGREETYYDCEWSQAYNLVRIGRIIRLTEDRFGEQGATVASNLLELGHARVSDFLAAYGYSTAKPAKGKKKKFEDEPIKTETKVEADAPIATVEELKTVMTEMLAGGFLVQVEQHHMHPRTDIVNGIRAELTRNLRGGFTSELKLNKEVSIQTRKRLAKMFENDGVEHSGMKIKAAPLGGRAKKRKKVSIYDEAEEIVEREIDEEIVVRVNHEKFLVLFRNAELVSLSEKRLGKVTSQVYAEVVKLLEPRIHRCQAKFGDEDGDEDNTSAKKVIKISTLEISKNFPEDIELEGSITSESPKIKKLGKKRAFDDVDDELPKKNGKGKRNGLLRHSAESEDEEEESEEEEEEREENGWDDEDMDPKAITRKKRMKFLKMHLQLLEEDSFKFLQNEGNRGAGEWSVNYKELGKKMRGLELEKVVTERFDRVGTRLLRIIKDKGKLDEKQIANISLVKQNKVRGILSSLHEAGHLELQEVPKSQPPQVSRTYFLWYFDNTRANKLLLSEIYQAMSRNIQRTAVEKEKRKSLIAKSERSDVKANYEEYLSKNEKAELDIWRNREERLLVQLMRLDRVVMILKDF